MVSQRSNPSFRALSRCSETSPDGEVSRTCTPMQVVALAERRRAERHHLAGERLRPVSAPRHRRAPRARAGCGPAAVSRPLCHSRASRTGMDEALRQGRERVLRVDVDHDSNLPRRSSGRQATGPSARTSLGAEEMHRGAGERHDVAGHVARSTRRAATRRRSTTARRSATRPRSGAGSRRSGARCRGRSSRIRLKSSRLRGSMPRRTAACGATDSSSGRSTSSRRARRTSP